MREPTEQGYLANLREAAPVARRAALAHWRAAFAWTWLAWRIGLRIWSLKALEAIGWCFGILFVALVGWLILVRALALGTGGAVKDGWRSFWRRG